MRVTVVRKLCVAGICMFASAFANANYSCIGPVTGVTVGPSGVVSGANIGGISWGYFCSVSTPENGASVDACRAILALLMSAEAQGKSVEIWFSDGLTCATRPSWTWQTGWYFGPRIVT
jgi:hypothetical protein